MRMESSADVADNGDRPEKRQRAVLTSNMAVPDRTSASFPGVRQPRIALAVGCLIGGLAVSAFTFGAIALTVYLALRLS